MKVSKKMLESLLELQSLEIDTEKLKVRLQELASGKSLEQLRDQILSLNQQISQQRIELEELEREQSRVLGDLKLVEDRIAKDRERLQKTAIARDAIGMQHELETLSKRKAELEESELIVLERLESANISMTQNTEQKSQFEKDFQSQKEQLTSLLHSEKVRYDQQLRAIAESAEALPEELVAIYMAKRKRGLAIGRLLRNTCGACNMGLTAAAASELLAKADDELISCPECSAILVRN